MYVNDTLCAFFVTMFNKCKDDEAIKFFFEGAVPQDIFLSIYKTFIKENGLIPIEDLPKEKKIELTTECRKTGLNFTNETLTNACRILYTLNFINENS